MKNYLPLGSVVLLKGAKKKVMIIGRSQICDDATYDYSAVLFPEGYLNKDQMFVFNNEDIDVLYYVGMQNDEEFNYRAALVKEVENQKNTEE